MGTCLASSYADLFMGAREGKMLETSREKPIVWISYIYDVFFIWLHGRPALETFITRANIFYHTTKFTSEISLTQIPFIHMVVSLKDGQAPDRPFLQRKRNLQLCTLRILLLTPHKTKHILHSIAIRQSFIINYFIIIIRCSRSIIMPK